MPLADRSGNAVVYLLGQRAPVAAIEGDAERIHVSWYTHNVHSWYFFLRGAAPNLLSNLITLHPPSPLHSGNLSLFGATRNIKMPTRTRTILFGLLLALMISSLGPISMANAASDAQSEEPTAE